MRTTNPDSPFLVTRFSVTMFLTFVAATVSVTAAGGAAPNDPGDIKPIMVGQSVPPMQARSATDAVVDLNAAFREQSTLLIFYRGGWCPYCTTHLGQLQQVESKLLALGVQVIAVSPDRTALLEKTAGKQKVTYRLLSDSDMSAASALGIAFRVDDDTVSMYKSKYDIDLEADSGQTHHLLPVPAAFLIGQDGVVRFAYVNPNYRERVDTSVLLAAAEALVRKPSASK